MKFPLSVRYSGCASLVVAVSLLLLPLGHAQRPAKPAPKIPTTQKAVTVTEKSPAATFDTLLSADADSVCGAAYGARDVARTNRRNGYRHRDLDTRIGTLDVAVPKLREGATSRSGC